MNKTKKQFPKALTREDHFKSPIWFADAPEFVNELNKAYLLSFTPHKLHNLVLTHEVKLIIA